MKFDELESNACVRAGWGQLKIDYELPMKDQYCDLILRLIDDSVIGQ